jgi:geranylgeranyl diphosphate synthase type I
MTGEPARAPSCAAREFDPGQQAAQIGQCLDEFLDARCCESPAEMAALIGPVRGFVAAGGKRIRPLLCMAAWHGGRDRAAPGPDRNRPADKQDVSTPR